MNPQLQQRLKSSANWFYWIAGLSLVNVFTMSQHFEFVAGSGIVQVAPDFASRSVAYIIDAIVIGGFALFGLLGSRRQTWAFVLGMLLYAADGGIYVLGQDYLPAIFHAYVLWLLYLGLRASMALNQMPVDNRMMVMPHQTTAPEPLPPSSPTA